MAEHDALGIAGAARGVLDQRRRRVVDLGRRRWRFRCSSVSSATLSIVRKALDLRVQQATDAAALRNGHQHGGAGVAQNAGLPAQMVLDLRQPHRRIDRNRNGAGIEDAEEGDEEIEAGRQHQRDAVARHDVARDETGRDAARRVGEIAVGQAIGLGRVVGSKLKWTRSRCCAACQSSASVRVAASEAGATSASGRAGSGILAVPSRGRARSRARARPRPSPLRRSRRSEAGPGTRARCAGPIRCVRGCRSRDRDRAGSRAPPRRRAPAAPELLNETADDRDELAASRKLAGGFRVGRGR